MVEKSENDNDSMKKLEESFITLQNNVTLINNNAGKLEKPINNKNIDLSGIDPKSAEQLRNASNNETNLRVYYDEQEENQKKIIEDLEKEIADITAKINDTLNKGNNSENEKNILPLTSKTIGSKT